MTTENKPSVAAGVVAELTQQAPARVRRKLDKQPDMAESWEWNLSTEKCVVSNDDREIVLQIKAGVIETVDCIQCNCLLSPRCLHALAVVTVLPIAAASRASDSQVTEHSSPVEDLSGGQAEVRLTANQQEAIGAVQGVLAHVLAAGGRTAGSLLQAKLLRAIHSCRCHGLHRLAANALRILQGIRNVRVERNLDRDLPHQATIGRAAAGQSWISEALVADLLSALELAQRLIGSDTAALPLIGTARRRYQQVPSLVLHGLFCEPLHTRSGYAGVVSYFIDHDGQVLTVSDVRAGDAGRILEAWHMGVSLGDLSIPHRQLSRKSLLMQLPNVSSDKRIGNGKSTRAAASIGAGWNHQMIAQRFAASWEMQIQSVFDQLAEDPETRRPDWDLVFLTGRVVGPTGPGIALLIEGTETLVELSVQQEGAGFLYRDNLAVLAHGVDLPLRCIARLNPNEAGRLYALAVAPITAAAGESLQLPEDWNGMANLGLDRLDRNHLPESTSMPEQVSIDRAEMDDGLEAFRRRILSIALGGRHSLPTRQLNSLARESQQLERTGNPAAGQLLSAIGRAAVESECNVAGARFPSDPFPMAQIWVACAYYERAARQSFQRQLWLE